MESLSSHILGGTVDTIRMFGLERSKAGGETHASFLAMQLVCAAAEGDVVPKSRRNRKEGLGST